MDTLAVISSPTPLGINRPGSVDLHRFRDLLAKSRIAADADEGLMIVEEALGLWRGEVFAGLGTPVLCRRCIPRDERGIHRLAPQLGRHSVHGAQSAVDPREFGGERGEHSGQVTALPGKRKTVREFFEVLREETPRSPGQHAGPSGGARCSVECAGRLLRRTEHFDRY